jgi:hypothetical protein
MIPAMNIMLHLKRCIIRIIAAFFMSSTLTLGLAQTPSQSADGSSLDLGGQVHAPSGSPTINSTYSISGGDQINWITYLQSKLNRPYEAVSEQTLPANFTWIKGSLITPPDVRITPRPDAPPTAAFQWQVNNVWLNTEPETGTIVQALRWTYLPNIIVNFGTVSQATNFSGTGDGFRIIPWGKNYYVINHHTSNRPLNCRVAATGATCPGFSASWLGLGLSGIKGSPLKESERTYYVPMSPMESLNMDPESPGYGNLYVGASTPAKSGFGNVWIVCTNLDTLKSCGSWHLGVTDPAVEFVANLETIGTKYHVLSSSGVVYCFDIATESTCGSRFYTYFAQDSKDHRDGPVGVTSLKLDNKLFWSSSKLLFCHDPATGQSCSGWSESGYPSASGVFPVLTETGAPRGVCDVAGNCRTLSGDILTPTQQFRNYISQNAFWTYGVWNRRGVWSTNLGAITDTRIFSGGTNGYGVNCFDFAINSICPGYPRFSKVYTKGYTTSLDWTRPNCLLHLGDNSVPLIFDIDTGEPCGDGAEAGLPKVIDVTPADSYRCDPTRAKVTGWDQVRVSQSLPWGVKSGLAAIKVTLQDRWGTTLPTALKPVRWFAPNTYTLDISDIPYATYRSLKVTVQMTGIGGLTTSQRLGIDVTWIGDPMQVCFRTTAPSPAECETKSVITTTLAKFENPVGIINNTLSADKVFSPGVPNTGYAAVSMVTTHRALMADIAQTGERKTQIAQGRYNMSNLTGDVWLFNLKADGSIDPSSLKNANAQINPTNYLSRPVFSAQPSTTTVLGSMSIFSLSYTAASAEQQTRLDTDLSGNRDSQGSNRVHYLRGSQPSAYSYYYRPFSAQLGPVINSGPVLRHPAPTAGLPESLFPGYTAYRTNEASKLASRSPMAIWGGNDGALHGFSLTNGSLKESWSFVPDVMLSEAARYANTTQQTLQLNPYFIDNVPMIGHVDLSGTAGTAWTSVVVTTYGQGARAITALDLPGDGNITSGRGVLFEYTNTTPGDLNKDGIADLRDLGFIVSPPASIEGAGAQQIIRLNDNGTTRWAVLVGNGIQSATGKAVLYAFYLDANRTATNSWTRIAVDEHFSNAANEPDLKAGNGLSSPRPVDTNGDGIADLAYAGDQRGNLWRFDISNIAQPKVTRLYKTTQGPLQAIQGAPLAIKNTTLNACPPTETRYCYQVVFGTGSYFTPTWSDAAANKAPQFILSILDNGTGTTVASSSLVANKVSTVRGPNGIDYRQIAANPIDYPTGKRGWYLPLGANEHLVSNPRLLPNGNVTLPVNKPITAGPNATSCSPASSWLYVLNPLTGTPAAGTFDINDDGKIDDQDLMTLPDGRKTSAGAMALAGQQFGAPSILLDPSPRSNTLSIVLPGLGQPSGIAGTWGNGGTQGSKLLKHSDKKTLGRMTWREVY